MVLGLALMMAVTQLSSMPTGANHMADTFLTHEHTNTFTHMHTHSHTNTLP